MAEIELKRQAVGSAVLEAPAGPRPVSVIGRAQQLIQSTPRMLFARSGGRAQRRPKVRFRLTKRSMFFLLVLLPTFTAAFYLFAIASDQFLSEARFVVRSPQKQGVSGLGALLQGSGVSGVKDDAFYVLDFIKSRDALKDIEDKVHFRDMVNRPGADFLARFPGPSGKSSFEDLYDHYSDIVNVVHDASTGIATLKVRAFNATDAQELAEALLESSERLVNRMNERATRDAIGTADKQVAIAEQRSVAAQKALTTYRISVGVVDPVSTTKSYFELSGGLQKELAAARTQLMQSIATSPNSPGIPAQRDRVNSLEQQVASERGKLLGADGSLVGTFAEFERLTLESEFAAKALVAANTMLEGARVDAMRKQLYLERVVEPNLADLSRYPRRFLATLTIFGTAFLAYAIIWLLIVNAREHAS